MIYFGRLVFVHRNSLHLAGALTRPLFVDNSRKRANLGTGAAVHTLRFINMRNMLMVKRNSAALTYIFTTMRQTAAARIGDLIAAHGAFVTGGHQNLNHTGIFHITAHGQLNAIGQNGTFLVNTAAHGRRVAGHNGFGNIQHIVKQCAVPRPARHLAQYLVL